MKTCTLILLVCGGCFALGFVFAAKKSAPTATAALPAAEAAPVEAASEAPATATVLASAPAPSRTPTVTAPVTSQEQASKASAEAPEINVVTNHALSPMARAVKTLVSSDVAYHEKEAAWKQIMGAGQLDQAIEALKQGIAENPDSAAYKAALGQAELKKASVLGKSGASVNQMGIMAMQADQNFDEALKLDPANWDAQFYKAAAMYYWPAELNKGPEVVQRLAALIDQQEAQMPKPEFARTYVLLGDQYLKMGQKEFAYQTWRLGLQKFPTDAALQKKAQPH